MKKSMVSTISWYKRWITVLLGLLVQGTAPAWAALGAEVSSIEHDSQVVGGVTHAVIGMERYDRHEITTAGGLQLHEFADHATGRIFALSWSGQNQPDLQTLLGDNFAEYRSALVARRARNHHFFTLQSGTLLIQIVRLPRGFAGSAQVPALIPAGVGLGELR